MTASFRATAMALVGALFLFAVEGAAQQLVLSGTVRDASGVIPGATVSIRSGNAELATTTTDGVGAYRFDGLTVGGYELAFTAPGFDTLVRNVSLGPNTGPVNAVLSVGRVSTTLTVAASVGRSPASRLPVPDDDIPAQVTSVPAELMRQQASGSIGEAIKNVSGVTSTRWYGAYDQFTIRGFFDPDRWDYVSTLVDGLRMTGNRYATQTNNIQSVEVLKGPSSVIYGRGAVGGAINIIRKKPEAVRAYDFSYRGGRFNTHQVTAGATGPITQSSRVLYRIDAAFEDSDGWRGAGGKRLNAAPSLIWVMGENARLTVHQNFNRDRFNGDGGVPFNITTLPSYRPSLRFNMPQDRVLVEDSQTQVMFDGSISPNWDIRNALLVQRTSDRYFVTEGVYGDPANNRVFRDALDFHHTARPVQNQTELVGRLSGFGRHTLLLGYEYQDERVRTDVTDDGSGCRCGYWENIPAMDLATMQETQTTPLDIETVSRRTWAMDRIHSIYWQDQIDATPQLKFNVGGRYADYDRRVDRQFVGDGDRFRLQTRQQTAYTYRAGVVYAPQFNQQFYFAAASAFTPVRAIPADGSELKPSTSRSLEVGHRWQGLDGRVDTNLAFYRTVRNNVNIRQAGDIYVQVGEQMARGVDLDVNTDLGGRIHLLLNYGFTQTSIQAANDALRVSRYAPKHTANAWLRKDWASGFNASIGGRFVAALFSNDANTARIPGYTVASGAVGYRADQWEWTLNAENLFNRKRYFIPAHFTGQVFPGQPINVSTTIRLKFN